MAPAGQGEELVVELGAQTPPWACGATASSANSKGRSSQVWAVSPGRPARTRSYHHPPGSPVYP